MHHILEKNKRVFSAKRLSKISTQASESSLQFSSNKSRSNESQKKFLKTISTEGQEILAKIQKLQRDLKYNQETFGDSSELVSQNLFEYVNMCNESGLYMIKKGEFRVATEILHQCEYLLMSPLGLNYPQYKFQTLNNLAHAHNVQANVRLSLKYLLRSLDFALQIEGIEEPSLQRGKQSNQLVETYLNICNAYSFLGQNEEGLQFIDQAIDLSHRLIQQLMEFLDSDQFSTEERNLLAEQYHQQVHLHSMSYHTKGQIFEKLKKFEDAIAQYQIGKEIVEKNYGPQHKTYMDFVNAINGARLRIKYLQHSNLPTEEKSREKERQPSDDESASGGGANTHPQGQGQRYDSHHLLSKQLQNHSMQQADKRYSRDTSFQSHQAIPNEKNLFLQEMERMKPMKQKRLRPASAKQHQSGPEVGYRGSQPLRISSNRSYFDIPRSDKSGPSLESVKNRSVKRIHLPPKNKIVIRNLVGSPMSSNRSQVYEQKRRISNQRRHLENKIQRYQQNEHSKSRSHHQECASCQEQIQEIRKLQQESQKLMVLLSQHSQQQSQSQPSLPNRGSVHLQQLNEVQMNQAQSQNIAIDAQQNIPQYPYYQYQYPPSMPVLMPMMSPYMYAPPPAPGMYPFPFQPPGLFMPPPRPPMPHYNNFMGASQGSTQMGLDRESPNKGQPGYYDPHNYHWDQFRQQMNGSAQDQTPDQARNNLNFYPQQDRSAEDLRNQQMASNYSDTNEKDSKFGEMFHHELQDSNQNTVQKTNLNQLSNIKILTDEITPFKHQPITKQKYEFFGEPPFIYLNSKVKLQNNKRLAQAAITIQKFFRKFKCRRNFSLLKTKNLEKLTLLRQIYTLKQLNLRPRKVILTFNLILSITQKAKQGGLRVVIKKVPELINIDLYDQLAKKVVYNQSVQLGQLKMDRSDKDIKKNKYKVDDIRKAILEYFSSKEYTGYPHEDFFFDKSTQGEGDKAEVDEDIEDDYDQNSFKSDSDQSPAKGAPLIQQDLEQSSPVNSRKSSVSSHAAPQPTVQVEQVNQRPKTPSDKSPEKSESNISEDEIPVEDDYDDAEFNTESPQKETPVQQPVEMSPPKPSQRLLMLQAVITIQRKFRQHLAKLKVAFLKAKKKKDEKKGKKKKTICKFIKVKDENAAQVELKSKASKEKKGTWRADKEAHPEAEYKIEAKNLNKNAKGKKKKLKLDKLPVPDVDMEKYLKKYLRIIWDKDGKIKDIKIVEEEEEPVETKEDTEQLKREEERQRKLEAALKIFQDAREKKKIERLRKITKAQALIRGWLARRKFKQELEYYGEFKIIYKLARRLSNNKLYYIFLLSRSDQAEEDVNEPYYLVTLREVTSIFELYDLEISLDMARKIFSRKTSTPQEIEELIKFDTNKQEFIMMLNCLDIINEEFSLDFKKFRLMQLESNQLRMFDHNQRKVGFSIYDSNTIPEADSKFEQSPDIAQQKAKSNNLPTSKPLIDLKKQEPAPVPKKKKKLKRIDYKMLALIRIQAAARKYLAQKRLEAKNIYNFRNKYEDPDKHLFQVKQGAVNCCGMYFMFFIYTDKTQETVRVTIKSINARKTVINLKKIVLSDFGEEAEMDDLPGYINDTFEEHGQEIMFDERTGQIRRDWLERLHEFLQANL